MSTSSPLVEGYPRLGAQMGHFPETAILRRFSSLNSQNLLYLQAEMVHLEKRLRELEAAASQERDGNKRLYAKDWYWLKGSTDDGDGELWNAVLEAKAKLKEYNDALLQQVALSALPEPTTNNLNTLRLWLEGRQVGNLALIGEDHNVWGTTNEPHNHASDLAVIKKYPATDYFSKWVVEKLLVWSHQQFLHQVKKPSDIESGVTVYESDNLLRYTSYTTTIIASLLPVISTIVLYNAQKVSIRLGLTALFTFIFGFCLTFFTNAERREIFTAVAAFSAVQVVFISGNGLPTASSH